MEGDPSDVTDAHAEALEEIRASGVPWAFEPRPTVKQAARAARRSIRARLRNGGGIALVTPQLTSPYSDPAVVETMRGGRALAFGAIIAEAAEVLTAADQWQTFPVTIHHDACATCRTDSADDCRCRPLLTWLGARC